MRSGIKAPPMVALPLSSLANGLSGPHRSYECRINACGCILEKGFRPWGRGTVGRNDRRLELRPARDDRFDVEPHQGLYVVVVECVRLGYHERAHRDETGLIRAGVIGHLDGFSRRRIGPMITG